MLTNRKTSDDHARAQFSQKWIGLAAEQIMFSQSLFTDSASESIVLPHARVCRQARQAWSLLHTEQDHIIQKKSGIFFSTIKMLNVADTDIISQVDFLTC